VNLVGNLILIPTIGHVGPPLATALASCVNVTLLYLELRRRGHFIADSRLRHRLPRLAFAAVIMGAALFGLDLLIEPYTTGPILIRFMALAGLVAGGVSIYGIACFLTGAYRVADLRALLRRR